MKLSPLMSWKTDFFPYYPHSTYKPPIEMKNKKEPLS